MAKHKFKAPKGMRDVMPAAAAVFRHVEETFRETCRLFGYREIRTPHLEATDLFCRTVGETTDIVEKEMYTLTTKGGDELALRPENTAGVVRAYLEHGLHRTAPLQKLFYWGEMFRHEAKQKKRYREFTQAGVEFLGVTKPWADVDVIALAVEFFRRLGLRDVRVELSTFGTPECRKAFRAALIEFFRARQDELCGDCKRRLEKNVFRLLDCKEDACRALVSRAPSIDGHLDDDSRRHFDEARDRLNDLGIAYRLNPNLVRGLDYYTHTIFEIFPAGSVGRQDALGAGGRYDGLAETIGGPSVPAVGFALGIDRTVLELRPAWQEVREPMVLAAGCFYKQEDPSKADEATRDEILYGRSKIAHKRAMELRRADIACAYEGEVRRKGKQCTVADKQEAGHAVLFGGDELKQGMALLRKTGSKEDQEPDQKVPLENLVDGVRSAVVGPWKEETE